MLNNIYVIFWYIIGSGYEQQPQAEESCNLSPIKGLMTNTFMISQLTSTIVDQICKAHLAVFQRSFLLRTMQQNKHKQTTGLLFFEEEHIASI